MKNQPQAEHTARGEKTGHYPGSPCSGQMDIRQFLAGNKGVGERFSFIENNTSKDAKDEPFDKTRVIRNKMAEARRAADKDMARLSSMSKKTPMKEWEGERVTFARDVDNEKVQDHEEVVVVGADVEAL